MKISSKLQNILLISVWVIVAAGVLTLMSFVGVESSKILCKGVIVNIVDENEIGFVDRTDIIQLVKAKQSIIGHHMSDININVLEKTINANPYILKAEVYSSIDGWLHTDVVQRNPLLRIINNKDESFYIDTEGKYMPLSEKFTEPVIVANGFIFDTYIQKQVHDSDYYRPKNDSAFSIRMIDQLFYLAKYIDKDTTWDAMFEQIYVNADQEIELIPRLGNQVVLLGDVKNMDEKLEKLKVFYQKGLNATGWDQYDLINIKFKGQVVCRKRNQLPS